MSDPLSRRLALELRALARQGLDRRLPPVERLDAVRYRIDERPVVGLCSNDYLALAADPLLVDDARAPSGAGASRLVNGDWPELRELEPRLAALAGTEDAVLFPSGFQANVGALPALIRAGDSVYSDRLAHASLIDGLRLSSVRPTVLPHGHPPPPATDSAGMSVWVTESIFSMDGDRPDEAAVRAYLAAGHVLYLDEAHAMGLFRGGRPWSTHHGLAPTVMLGTLGKALGCAGAFVAASKTTCHFLRTRARSFVFSTGVSPLVARRIHRAVDVVTSREGDARRQRLWDNARHLSRALGGVADPPSPIFPVVIGDNQTTLDVAAALLERGFHVQPIRPPTVPAGTARLRITVSAAHDPAQLDAFVAALHEACATRDVTPTVSRGVLTPPPTPPRSRTGTDPTS